MNTDPSSTLIAEESNHLFLSFCTFVMNLKGKKLSIQNVFIQVLQNEKLRRIMKEILNLDTDYELVKTFLEFDSSVAKSKYVTKMTRNAKYICGRENKISKKSRN